MSLLHSLREFSRRVGLWFIAAGITLAVLFTSVLIYKWTVYEPDPPTTAECQSLQILISADSAVEAHLYQCQRGKEGNWQGYEVWLYEPYTLAWQRVLTAASNESSAACMSLGWREDKSLEVFHSQSRGDLNVAQSSVIYYDPQGRPETLSINTERQDNCPMPGP
ncbi:hypothetical protein IDSA_05100 [Pseudidiomarina salinarum]|uniref:Uncharacterized protein n=1 Tax=Pseudidiomarina salinarum TaxID=435908 RepID=A0A094JHM4_9GAMM|nr:hypothetical protein [Pseudidiomarina salinarum]KFZ32051.1 hypothetical protein IDSA_05100 [Pseudidiomarina salinarum]RUO70169.1 hypothetical protein CWI79_01485 [Pseudidiomarina salinarum]